MKHRLIWARVEVLAACLGLHCSSTVVVVHGRAVKVVSAGDLPAAAEAAREKTCAEQSTACGPFPCSGGKCVVAVCDDRTHCSLGFCSEGYCVRAEEDGARACRPFAPPTGEAVDWQVWSGCRCTPESEGVGRDEARCGSFPCTAAGCYVHACEKDSDCSSGICASHTAWPHGYCVTDDAI